LSNKGSGNDFGQEAIQVILKRMEDLRGQFGVIVAGYPENMSEFVASNPGLKSRFDRTFNFLDYSPDEMYLIALSILATERITPDAESGEHLRAYFNFIYSNRDKHFGNARTVRQVVAEAIKNQNLRLAEIPSAERTKEILESLVLNDVKEFVMENKRAEGSSLGFKFSS